MFFFSMVSVDQLLEFPIPGNLIIFFISKRPPKTNKQKHYDFANIKREYL